MDDPNYGDELAVNASLLSTCCNAVSLGEVVEDAYGHLNGICSECRDHATFEPEIEDERKHKFPSNQ